MKNKFAVIAGDRRMLNLALSLADLSYEVNAVGFEKTEVCSLVRCKDCLFDAVCDVNAVVFPVPLTDDGISVRAPFSDGEIRISDVLQCVDAKKTVVFVPKITEEMKKYKLRYINYMEDESLLVQNAYLTAEGALSEIIRLTDFSLLGAKVLVIGNGRVGKAVSKILRNIGADVTVSARKTSDFAKIKTEGMKFIHTEKISKTIGAFNIVINTVPAPVLGEKQLAKMKDKAVIFDLAPNTGGVEKDAVNKYKIRYVPLPGLPGIYSPKTAGEVICKTVVSLAEGGNI